jgi:hypothetical protein
MAPSATSACRSASICKGLRAHSRVSAVIGVPDTNRTIAIHAACAPLQFYPDPPSRCHGVMGSWFDGSIVSKLLNDALLRCMSPVMAIPPRTHRPRPRASMTYSDSSPAVMRLI